MKREYFFELVIVLGLICFRPNLIAYGQEKPIANDLFSRLKSLKGVYVKKIDALPGFKAGYELAVVQPVDHNNPKGPTFTQRIFLSHRDFSKPVVLETEGYGATWPKEREMAKILDANQIIVEHRYYESSKPKPLDWQYLTSWQAASDHHRVVELLKTIYNGKWVSSGRSKGGMAALFHRVYYPDDVDATVAYVAPIMIGPIDSRFEKFMNSSGDQISRDAIREFQRTCLERRSELMPILKDHAAKQKLSFPCSLDEVFEWAVIEFPFSFWFENHKRFEIPKPDASHERIFAYLIKVKSLSGLSTSQINFDAGLYYQQYTELGYYNYPVTHIKHLLQFVKEPDFSFYVPTEAKNAGFNKDVMPAVLNFLQNSGDNIIYLYGEFDIYTSCAVELTGKTNAIKLIANGFGHQFNIGDFSENQKAVIYNALETWLNNKLKVK